MYENVETGELTERQIVSLLAQPVLARIATASLPAGRPHVVPVWYLWDGSAVWIHSMGSSRKVRNVRSNPYCSVVIDAADSGVDFWAVLIEGDAELVPAPAEQVHEMATRIYSRYVGPDGALEATPQSWIHDPDSLLIKIVPQRIMSWYSARGS